eukprot:scaffold15943_cov68-Phaeocystis_antarctica.AAC.3
MTPGDGLGAAEVGARLPVGEVRDAHAQHVEDDRDVRLERQHVLVGLALAGVVDQAVGDEERHLHDGEEQHGHGEVVDLEDGDEDRVDRQVDEDRLLRLREGSDHLPFARSPWNRRLWARPARAPEAEAGRPAA